MKSAPIRPNQSFYEFIATANPDDQLLIAQSLRGSMPTVRLNYAQTPEQTLQCLVDYTAEYYNFPRLLILDLAIAEEQLAWQLLEAIRVHYPTLTIVMTSLDHRSETRRQAYTLGAHAFISKSRDWAQWKEQVDGLAHYWLKLAILAGQPLF
ncbi:response regulator [Spirosoma sp. HMF4905]|uniref:Response regulator n=1 Tax=Spirosoma arboris TaxID=2682092 RepID=A0A7K1SFI8_9BACT|nr:response regulator [Spirosoma arboris]MVM32494.1 response regulator [Spirosoma arboris]